MTRAIVLHGYPAARLLSPKQRHFFVENDLTVVHRSGFPTSAVGALQSSHRWCVNFCYDMARAIEHITGIRLTEGSRNNQTDVQ